MLIPGLNTFEAFDQRAQLRRRMRRISFDGVEGVSWSSSVLSAWSAPEERWVPVQVDLLTGRATGGGYDLPDGEADEILHNGK